MCEQWSLMTWTLTLSYELELERQGTQGGLAAAMASRSHAAALSHNLAAAMTSRGLTATMVSHSLATPVESCFLTAAASLSLTASVASRNLATAAVNLTVTCPNSINAWPNLLGHLEPTRFIVRPLHSV